MRADDASVRRREMSVEVGEIEQPPMAEAVAPPVEVAPPMQLPMQVAVAEVITSEPPLPVEAEGLQLHLSSKSATGYKGVDNCGTSQQRPFRATQASLYLGSFATAVEAAVCYARFMQLTPDQRSMRSQELKVQTVLEGVISKVISQIERNDRKAGGGDGKSPAPRRSGTKRARHSGGGDAAAAAAAAQAAAQAAEAAAAAASARGPRPACSSAGPPAGPSHRRAAAAARRRE